MQFQGIKPTPFSCNNKYTVIQLYYYLFLWSVMYFSRLAQIRSHSSMLLPSPHLVSLLNVPVILLQHEANVIVFASVHSKTCAHWPRISFFLLFTETRSQACSFCAVSGRINFYKTEDFKNLPKEQFQFLYNATNVFYF